MASSPKSSSLNPLLYTIKDTLIASVASNDHDLTQRQVSTFLTVFLDTPEGGHTVRGLAATLNVSKPAITRALDRLGELGFVERKVDPTDRRSVLVQKTTAGAAYLRKFSKYITDAEKAGSTRKAA